MSIANRYDWNNPKEINNEKIYDVFVSETLQNKIKIWRLLNNSRKRKLKQRWKKEAEQKRINRFLNHAKNVLKNLGDIGLVGDTLKDSEIKNSYELWLVCGIAQSIGILPLTTDSAIDTKQDRKSFESTRAKLLEYLKLFEMRKMGIFSEYTIEENQLIKELERLEYVEPPTRKSWELKEREEYLHMMYVAGIGKDRAKLLYTKLKQWSKNAPIKRYQMCNFEWKKQELEKDQEYQEIKRLLEIVAAKKEFTEEGFNMPDDYETLYTNAISKLQHYGLDYSSQIEKALSEMRWYEKQLLDNAFIERRKADDYYAFIRKRAETQYPQIFQ